MYIHQLKDWPQFTWDNDEVGPLLADARYQQGHLLGMMDNIGFKLREQASLENLTEDVVRSSEIEGEILDVDQVRSSIARRLGIEIAGLVPADRHVDGVVEMMLDATQKHLQPLSEARLFGWQAALFPTGWSGMHRVTVGTWRDNSKDDPMQVVSGAMGRETVHFQAPDAEVVPAEMAAFISWFNNDEQMDPVLKAAIAHLWFITIHPFDDGNGRIARAITDMQFARADGCGQRFYSMSSHIRTERKSYYDILEKTQRDSLDVTEWISWFLLCFKRAITDTASTLDKVIRKARFWEQAAMHAVNDRQKMMLNKLLDGFHGKLTSSKWAIITKTSQDTAVRDIQDLVQRGLLVKGPAGGRSTSYILSI